METERLILRKWVDSDAAELFRYAQSEEIGPITGWPPHKTIEESLTIIQTIYQRQDAYAIVLKETGLPIGCVSLMDAREKKEDECELGFWLGRPYWNGGIMTEAVREMLRYGFEERKLSKIWCGYYEGNERSKRVQEKCGFTPYCIHENQFVELMNEYRTDHMNLLTKEDWEKQKNDK